MGHAAAGNRPPTAAPAPLRQTDLECGPGLTDGY